MKPGSVGARLGTGKKEGGEKREECNFFFFWGKGDGCGLLYPRHGYLLSLLAQTSWWSRAGWAGANLVPLQRDWPAGGRAELRPRD